MAMAILGIACCVVAQMSSETYAAKETSCKVMSRQKRHRFGLKMNYTLYGSLDKPPVLIINTLLRGAREWDEFARMLCESNQFSVAIVHTAVTSSWKALEIISAARAEMSSPEHEIVFAKRTGALYAVKYAIRVGLNNISRMGLVSPNITELGDIWTLNGMSGRLCLFWNVEDRAVDYFVAAPVWETTIMPPTITVRDTERALSHQLLRSMLKFAKHGTIMRKNYRGK
jgi:hypothetical protein